MEEEKNDRDQQDASEVELPAPGIFVRDGQDVSVSGVQEADKAHCGQNEVT